MMTDRRRMVVVDDNAEAARGIASLLESWGHEVYAATDGRGALQLIYRIRPEFLFLDLGMPGMDGFQVARQLRGDPAFSRLAIIAVSGLASEEDRQAAREAGVDHQLTKPADVRFLYSLVGDARSAAPGS